MSVTTHRPAGKWTVTRFRYLADICKGSLPSSNYGVGLKAQGVPYLTMEYLRGEVSEPVLVSSDSDLLLAADDDILLLWDGSNAGEFLRAKRGAVSSTTALVTPKSVDPTFFFWACKAQEDRVRAETVGMGIPHVNGEFLVSLRIQLPHTSQQRAIAHYLDRETARLDALVTEKERLLDLLAEKRQALITRAVTRGLSPNSPLRESGVPWLGKIPVHWETRRLKFLSPQITVGIVVTPAKYYETAGVPCLRSLNVREHSLLDVDLVFISEESNLLHSKSIIRAGDLVAVRSGQPGTTAVVDQRFDGANCIDLIIIRGSHCIDSAFLAYFLNSTPAKMQFLSGSGGAIQQHFNIETASGLVVPLPPLQEQRNIVAAVSKATAKVDALSTAARRTIVLLRERRSALIAGVVTGHINIGNAA